MLYYIIYVCACEYKKYVYLYYILYIMYYILYIIYYILYIILYIYIYIYAHVCGAFLKYGCPQIIHLNRMFHSKPIFWYTLSLWNPPGRRILELPSADLDGSRPGVHPWLCPMLSADKKWDTGGPPGLERWFNMDLPRYDSELETFLTGSLPWSRIKKTDHKIEGNKLTKVNPLVLKQHWKIPPLTSIAS